MKLNFCKKSNDVLNIKDNLIVLGNNMETDQNIYNVDTFRDKLRIEFLRYKNRKNKGGRADHKMNLIDQIRLNSFKIKIDLKEIPLCYRIYIQQNRIFEQDVYEFSVHDKFHRALVLSGFFFIKIASTFLNSSFFPKPIKRRIAI